MIDLVGLNIEKAKAGDSEAAKKLINEFCSTVRNSRDSNGKPHVYAIGSETHSHTHFNESLLDYLLECFTLLMSGKDDEGKRITADIALNLSSKGKRGVKAKSVTRETQLLRGMQAWEAYKVISGKNDMPGIFSDNLTPDMEAAFNEIAIKELASIHTVAKAYKEWTKLVDSIGK